MNELRWRRERDSNPRKDFSFTRFPEEQRPLEGATKTPVDDVNHGKRDGTRDAVGGRLESSRARAGHTFAVLRGALSASARHPRGFVVLGEHFSIGWPLFCLAFLLAVAIASVQEERDAAREMAELRAQRAAALTLAVECVDDEIECESVLATCTNVLGDGLGCACWQPSDTDGSP